MSGLLAILGIALAIDFLLSLRKPQQKPTPSTSKTSHGALTGLRNDHQNSDRSQKTRPILQEIEQPKELRWPPPRILKRKFRVLTSDELSPIEVMELGPLAYGEDHPDYPAFRVTRISSNTICSGVYEIEYTFELAIGVK